MILWCCSINGYWACWRQQPWYVVIVTLLFSVGSSVSNWCIFADTILLYPAPSVKGSLKKVESSFICRRCKGELSETRQVNSQVNGLHIDSDEYEIVDKLCYLGDMLSQEGGCKHAILKRIQTGWLKFRKLSSLLIGKGMSLKWKGIIYTTCIRPAVLYGRDMGNKGRGYKENTEEWNEDVEMDDRSEFKWKEK